MQAATDTKAALLNAAKRLLLQRGYAGVSVRELTAAAGANLGAVNYHFGSRENLLNEAIFEFFREWGDSIGNVEVSPDAEPLMQLAARARPTVERISEAQPLFLMCLEALLQSRRGPTELHRRLAEHYATQRERAGQFIRATESGRQLSPRMVEVVTSYMLAVADGLQLQALLDPEAIPTGEELAALYEGLAATAREAS